MKIRLMLTAALFFAGAAGAQTVQVSAENRAISITASETLRVDAEVAEVRVGYHNFGRTQQATMEENIRAANKITAALEKAFTKNAIESEALQLTRAYHPPERPAEERRAREFEARQSWTVRVSASDAQKVVDTALGAGANSVDGVHWTVKDPHALEARTAAVAMSKARVVAEQLAREQKAAVGQLLFASNTLDGGPRPVMMQAMARGGEAQPDLPPVRLFPQKVERTASILAIFALE